MIGRYFAYSFMLILDVLLVFVAAPNLINLHDTPNAVIGFVIWWVQPVVFYMLAADIIHHIKSNKDTNTHA